MSGFCRSRRSALPRWVLAVWSFHHTSQHRTQHPSVHTSRSYCFPTVRKIADRRNAEARRLVKLEHRAAEIARQENSELHQLRTSSSLKTMSRTCQDWAECMNDEDACSTPYHNFSPSPQYRPVLGVRHNARYRS
ncbi:hypothetical protein DSO57_1032369 [Entomophthora muscae]|uniref:Uncharacterized protein n=1 Tax=Entomophthora muscae TaxID=34485 RepID=A0ACC2RF51_9FUNG|nr:hypothetical protein DSO57_1032369 [Entomophthora muscae]